MEANYPKELAVRALEHSEVLHAKSPRHTPIQQRPRNLELGMRTFSVNEAISLSYSSRPIEACPRELDPSFDLWRNIGGLVDKGRPGTKTALSFYTPGLLLLCRAAS